MNWDFIFFFSNIKDARTMINPVAMNVLCGRLPVGIGHQTTKWKEKWWSAFQLAPAAELESRQQWSTQHQLHLLIQLGALNAANTLAGDRRCAAQVWEFHELLLVYWDFQRQQPLPQLPRLLLFISFPAVVAAGGEIFFRVTAGELVGFRSVHWRYAHKEETLYR